MSDSSLSTDYTQPPLRQQRAICSVGPEVTVCLGSAPQFFTQHRVSGLQLSLKLCLLPGLSPETGLFFTFPQRLKDLSHPARLSDNITYSFASPGLYDISRSYCSILREQLKSQQGSIGAEQGEGASFICMGVGLSGSLSLA